MSALPLSCVSGPLTKKAAHSLKMDRWFDVGDQKVFIKELILSGELGTQIWDAVRFGDFHALRACI